MDECLINGGKGALIKNNQMIVNNDLEDILESANREVQMSPKHNMQQKSVQVIAKVNISNSDPKKPPMIPSNVGSALKGHAKTPLKPTGQRFLDYDQSPIKVNDLLALQSKVP